jgi:hypothetical protein
MDPIWAAATVSVPVAVTVDVLTVALAVMLSWPLQPFAVYVAEALPELVTTVLAAVPAMVVPLGVTTAVPCAMHCELNVIVTLPPVYKVPVLSTIETVMLTVPPAESEVLARPMAPDTKLLPLPLPML